MIAAQHRQAVAPARERRVEAGWSLAARRAGAGIPPQLHALLTAPAARLAKVFAEAGLPTIPSGWFGMFLPVGAKPATVQMWNQALSRAAVLAHQPTSPRGKWTVKSCASAGFHSAIADYSKTASASTSESWSMHCARNPHAIHCPHEVRRHPSNPRRASVAR